VMARTEVTLVPQMGAEIGSTVTLTTTDGRVMSRDVPFPKGEPENPMSWDEMHAKFLEWSVGSVGEANAHALADMVGRLESVGSVRELSPHLVSIKED
jgi:2-methylcitrate dehydratase PrpD